MNDLCNVSQAAYKQFHSTETALLNVHNDMNLNIDNGKVLNPSKKSRQPRSTSSNRLYILSVKSKAGTRAFSVAAPIRFRPVLNQQVI